MHRVVAGQIVQFGDKQSRDATLREWWGKGPSSGSGKPIGVDETSKTRKHKAGTVAMAHAGDVRASDSQIYFALRPMPQLDGKHNIIGEVKSGMAIVPKLAVGRHHQKSDGDRGRLPGLSRLGGRRVSAAARRAFLGFRVPPRLAASDAGRTMPRVSG